MCLGLPAASHTAAQRLSVSREQPALPQARLHSVMMLLHCGRAERWRLQGLDWFLKTLRIDAFGILSHLFLQEEPLSGLQVCGM